MLYTPSASNAFSGILCHLCYHVRNHYAIIGRLKKSKTPYKNSHATDWMFLILLQLTTLTGIIIHFTRLLDLPMTTYVVYVVHLMIAVPMLVLEVPFAKWAHLAFRPVALYLIKVKEEYNRSLKESVVRTPVPLPMKEGVS